MVTSSQNVFGVPSGFTWPEEMCVMNSATLLLKTTSTCLSRYTSTCVVVLLVRLGWMLMLSCIVCHISLVSTPVALADGTLSTSFSNAHRACCVPLPN